MSTEMKTIAIFGGTGMTGRCVVQAALDRGFRARVLVRDETRLAEMPWADSPHVEVVRGDVLQPDTVAAALKGAHGAVLALGTRNDLAPTTVLSEGTRHVLAGMRAAGVRAVSACISAFLLYEPDKVPAQFRALTEDHRRMYELLRASQLDYVAVFPPHIAAERAGEWRVRTELNPAGSPGRVVGAGRLAAFLVEALDEPRFHRAVVGICDEPADPPAP